MALIDTLGLVVSVLVTFAFWSFIFKENILFRILEYTLLGFAIAHSTVMAWNQIRSQTINPFITGGQITLIIPILLGLLFYTRYFKSVRPLSRIPISLMVGVGTAVTMRAVVDAQIFAQIRATIWPTNFLEGLQVFIITLCVISYFIFTSPNKIPKMLRPLYTRINTLGRIAIMATMGSSWGGLLTFRYTMAISRLQDLVKLIYLIFGIS